MAVGVQASYRVGLDWLDSLCSIPSEQARPLGIFHQQAADKYFQFCQFLGIGCNSPGWMLGTKAVPASVQIKLTYQNRFSRLCSELITHKFVLDPG